MRKLLTSEKTFKVINTLLPITLLIGLTKGLNDLNKTVDSIYAISQSVTEADISVTSAVTVIVGKTLLNLLIIVAVYYLYYNTRKNLGE